MKENKTKTDDLKEKAVKMMLDYNHATGSSICIYDDEYNPLFPDITGDRNPENVVCPCCTNSPCRELHINAIKEANKSGGSYVYECKAGFVFWTSPIYTDGRFSGALRGTGFFAKDKKPVDFFANANNTHVMCNSEEESQKELNRQLGSYQEADREKIQSLSEMMQICAESLSSGSEDYHEILRRRAEQQEAIIRVVEDLRKKYPDPNEKPGYSFEKERALISALRKGEIAETKKLLNELIALMCFSYSGQYKNVQLRATELVVLLSRVEITPIKSGNPSMEANSQSLQLVQEAKTIEELTDILHTTVDRISNIISSFRGIPHAAALRKAESFIMENYTKKISLKEIATVAGLSPPYFSTIFKEEMGENLSKYLNRLRVEKASRLLLETETSLGEIAALCCFEDQSWFSKIFKAYTGISPGKYRNQGGGVIRDIGENNLSKDLRKAMKD